jgi:hypothetical protein
VIDCGAVHRPFGGAVLCEAGEPQRIRAVGADAALHPVLPGRLHQAVMLPTAPMHPLQAGDPQSAVPPLMRHGCRWADGAAAARTLVPRVMETP